MQVTRVVSAALIAALLLPLASGCGGERSAPASKEYHFTHDWFFGKIPRWRELLAEFAGRPNVHYLEIGVYEGRSLFWMLDNVLTHRTSRLVAVDIFLEDYEPRFLANLEASGAADRIQVIKGRGEYALKALPEAAFDVIYVDGGHAASTVFAQAALAWQLLKEGGILILDDYRWNLRWPLDLRPELTINAFLTAYSQELELISRENDVFVRKVARLCESYYCSNFFGGYVYDWQEQQLLVLDGNREVELSEAERKLVEEILAGLRPGQVEIELTPKQRQNPIFQRLRDRLGLDV
jgi:predicted O-methyltransferase YrrM